MNSYMDSLIINTRNIYWAIINKAIINKINAFGTPNLSNEFYAHKFAFYNVINAELCIYKNIVYYYVINVISLI